MRPLSLKIAGLHSFRVRQEVNFEQLCQGGVFGIFGPTGSGKSSILDAITLALFGKVERAERNTNGIMNHAENTLSVSFSFELSNATGTKVYRVERSYKRADEQRLRPVSSRLVEMVYKEESVLADKQGDVTSQVEAILGLTAEDFTRAVVLPQGRFAEFLTLEGKARRQMLERLFNLERYGIRLTEKLKVRTEEAKAAVNQIKAEQQGLGDCSQEALEHAKMRLEQAIQQAEEKRNQLLVKEKEMEGKRQIWLWQQEKDELETAYEEWIKQEEAIKQLEQKLQKAEQAESLRPYLEELTFSEQDQQHWQQQANQADLELQQVRATHEENRKAYEEARESRSRKEPQLAIQMESLRQALQLQNQITASQKELEQLREQFEQIGNDRLQKESEHQKMVRLVEKAIVRQTELKDDLEKKSIKTEYRQRITDALQAKQSLSFIHKEWNQCKQESKQKEESISKRISNQQFYQTTEREWHEKVTHQMDQILESYHALSETGDKLQSLQAIFTSLYKEKKEQLAANTEHRLAQQLVQQLRDGESCPVCGSVHHPSPAKITIQGDFSQLEEELVKLEQQIEESRVKLLEASQIKFQLEQLSKRLYESIDQDDLRVKELAIGSSHCPVERKSIDQTGDIEREYATTKEQIEATIIQLARIEQESKEIISGLTQIREKRLESRVQLVSEDETLAELKRKENQKREEYERLIEEWKRIYPDYQPETIEQLQAEMNQRDQEVEELTQRINTSIQFIEQHDHEAKVIEQRLRELEKAYLQLEMELANRIKSVEEQQNRLLLLTAGEEPQSKLRSVNAQLEQVKQFEEERKRQLDASEDRLRQVENQYTASYQSANLAQNRFIIALQKWEEVLRKAGFQNKDEVGECLTPQSIQNDWKIRIDSYRDAIKVIDAKRQNIDKLLKGSSLTKEEWEDIGQALAFAKQENEEALQRKARVARDYEEIEQKSLRWGELEKNRIEKQSLLDRLLKLQSVFRGNAFVDFIAEEQLTQITRDASTRLGRLTRGRYAIEVDSEGGFIMRDDANGGVKRPVTTLSGGETFLTSLALALSLSAQVQLRGEYPLEFFFLDEGFGTLDQELLETVVHALERLQGDHMSIGVISHVPELRERIPRKLIVEPAEPSGRGSSVKLEIM